MKCARESDRGFAGEITLCITASVVNRFQLFGVKVLRIKCMNSFFTFRCDCTYVVTTVALQLAEL